MKKTQFKQLIKEVLSETGFFGEGGDAKKSADPRAYYPGNTLQDVIARYFRNSSVEPRGTHMDSHDIRDLADYLEGEGWMIVPEENTGKTASFTDIKQTLRILGFDA